MRDESKGSFAVIRYNLRTYVSGGVVAIIKGKSNAETTLKSLEVQQSSEDRHEGWRYFLEKTDLKAGMDPQEATSLRQVNLELRGTECTERTRNLPDNRDSLAGITPGIAINVRNGGSLWASCEQQGA